MIKVIFATPVIDGKQAFFFTLLSRRVNRSKEGLCIILGRGQGDGDIGTRVSVGTCDSGTRDEGLENIKYETRGRRRSNTRTRGR